MKCDKGNNYGQRVEDMLNRASGPSSIGEKIEIISRQLLDVTYQAGTLVGSSDVPESLVINLDALDCFTFIDYVEAMRRSDSFESFRENLIKTRYRKGVVSFMTRNHFFTDWIENSQGHIKDVTKEAGGDSAVTVIKELNKKPDGSLYLKGISPVKRKIEYIPLGCLDQVVMDGLRTGDYAGIYSNAPGLDVSHVGIIIKAEDRLFLRHASSAHMKVVEEDFTEYMSGKPGLILLRPL